MLLRRIAGKPPTELDRSSPSSGPDLEYVTLDLVEPVALDLLQ